ncbi:MAG TPA: hypothetical protein VNI54_16335 [Thermoanaerobaculia bacterium]|nr:hypothetical protein [Thermoanaerobaculia bacterium]
MQIVRAGVGHVDLEHDGADALTAICDELPRHEHVALFAVVERLGHGDRVAAGEEREAGRRHAERDVDRIVAVAEHDRAGAAQRSDEFSAFTSETQGFREADESYDRRRVVHA